MASSLPGSSVASRAMTDSSTTAQQSGSGRARTLLALEDVSKSFGDLHVMRAVSLSLERGEVLVIVGPSGGGKSTLCRTINRLEPINSGSILLDGTPLAAKARGLAHHPTKWRMGVDQILVRKADTGAARATLRPASSSQPLASPGSPCW